MYARHLLRSLLALLTTLIALAPSATHAAAPAGTWTITGAMHQARAWHTATLLPSGLVLVAGGCTSTCDTTATAELYHPHTGSWASTGSMHDPRMEFTATLLPDGRVLATGGCLTPTCTDVLAGAELYDPRRGIWTQTGAMHTPRALETATLLPDGQVLVVGGISGGCVSSACSDILRSAELYNPRTGIWTMTGAMRQVRAHHTATLLPSGLVLIAGGASNVANNNSTTNPLTSAELYDPRTGTWTITDSLHTARSGHTAALLRDGLVLVVGGGNNAPAELYHPRTGAWTVTGFPHYVYDFETGEAATLLPNGLVLVAGNALDSSNNSADLYNPRTGRWTITGSLHEPRQFQPSTLLSTGQVLVAGGWDRNGDAIAGAELYQP
jgi:Kelch motif/Galactose oxidase, central domain